MIAKFSYCNQTNRISLIVASGLSRRVKNSTSSSNSSRRDFIMLSAGRITGDFCVNVKKSTFCDYVEGM